MLGVGPMARIASAANNQWHSFGPACKFKFGLAGWDVGLQFGWTDRSDVAVFKSILDFEL